ncbi:MAG: response regulator transcription factor [Anaerolineae bacterium]|jgi:DNA-binding NarL/FixJ family response regulator
MQILLADKQPKVRFGLRVLLERQPGLQVVGEVTNAEELLDKMGKDCPELVLLGWGLPGLQRANLLPTLRAVHPDLFVIALSGRTEMRQVALDAGADAFVCKCDPPERLLAAIQDCVTQKTLVTEKEVEQ